MKKSFRAVAASVALVLAVPAGVVVGTSSPALASCSGHAMPNLDDGYDSVLGAGSTGLALRTGPHVSCGLILRIPEGRVVGLQCYQQGDVVNQVGTWSAVNYLGNPGWVSDAYLKWGGSLEYCGDEGW